ncbi:Protein NirD [Nitrosopumilaceae archaeon]|nr:AsnC family transcriptional regulator [Nitrosopumilus sp.]CAI9832184.1 Protein NirD [Nitrosopumilaceae archaeon]MDA7941321.1 AsnC family transcriptional regulator [Nitrosopumilus sp.]MDA7942732.1 AsnC family transcriptional regulator [Nitrosopumilus sp.]MDA7945616.1 AsnC family transcriptional regulator [Nitrosopumilus sp.]
MDGADRDLLDEIQRSFPLVVRPFDELAGRLGTTPGDVKSRIARLRAEGILRQLSAIFDTRRLGYSSSLVAMEVEPARLEDVASSVNRHPGVSHNYERDHAFNLWFTLAVPPGADLDAEAGALGRLPGVTSMRMLPTLRLFKIGVQLEMSEERKREVRPSEPGREASRAPFVPTERDKEFVRQMQADLEISDEPFAGPASRLGITQEDLFAQMARYQELGVMRRFAAILRHRQAGFSANGMIVWRVPEGRIEEVGQMLGSFPQVSHCYQRPTYPDWPYNVFSMIHCRTRQEAAGVASEIQSHVGVDDYRMLFSLREFKKTRVEYFVEAPADLRVPA